MLAGYYIVNIINKVFELDEVIKSSVELIGAIIFGLIVSFILFKFVDIIISLTIFKNNKISFINLCYNGKFYIDNSLENILIGKNGPKIFLENDNKLTFNDVYKFKNIKYSILIAVILISSLFYHYLNSNILLVFLMAVTVYAAVISVIYLKYNESDAYNEVLKLCIYQNVLNYNVVNALKEKVFLEFNMNMEIELYLKLKILLINNNINYFDSDSNLSKIADRNIFILLYSEVLDNIFNIKNDNDVGYKYSDYYLELPVVEKLFLNSRKMTYKRDLYGLVNVLPYRLKKMLII